jgi:hypothetical protein
MAAVKKTVRKRAGSRPAKPQKLKFDRVLVVSAHPDDPDFGAGGSIAKLVKDGAQVTYVIVTDGSQGGEDPKQKDSELRFARRSRRPRPASWASRKSSSLATRTDIFRMTSSCVTTSCA